MRHVLFTAAMVLGFQSAAYGVVQPEKLAQACASITQTTKAYVDETYFTFAKAALEEVLSRATEKEILDFPVYTSLLQKISEAKNGIANEQIVQTKLIKDKPENWAQQLASSATVEEVWKKSLLNLQIELSKTDGLEKLVNEYRPATLPRGVSSFSMKISSTGEYENVGGSQKYVYTSGIAVSFSLYENDPIYNYPKVEGGVLWYYPSKPGFYHSRLKTGDYMGVVGDVRDFLPGMCKQLAAKYDEKEIRRIPVK